MTDGRTPRRVRPVLPRVLAMQVLGVALASCSPSGPQTDAGPGSDVSSATDVAPDHVDAAPCTVAMPGRTCTTMCLTLGSEPDGFTGLVPQACEVYCNADGGLCYGADGQLSACELEGDGDGGTEVFC